VAALPFSSIESVDAALDGDIAVFSADENQVVVLERSASGWSTTPVQLAGRYGSQVSIVDGTIAINSFHDNRDAVFLLRKNAAGAWTVTDVLYAGSTDQETLGPTFLFTGRQLWIYSAEINEEGDYDGVTYISELVDGGWTQPQALRDGGPNIIVGDQPARVLPGDRSAGEIYTWSQRDAAGAWTVRGRLISDEDPITHFGPDAIFASPERVYVGDTDDAIRGENFTAGNSGSVAIFSLRKRHNGVDVELGRAHLAVTPGAVYRMRFEAIGDALRVHVNARLRLEARDASISRGRYGLIASRTSATFDAFSAERP
jgi:hypothetical protein